MIIAIPNVLSPILGLPALVGGLYLLRMSWWPHRSGNDPHCRKCGYLLTGIESDRCPECGNPLSEASIVRGVQRRRVGLAWVGTLIGLLGLLLELPFGFLIVDQVDWYSNAPTFWLLHDARSSSPATADPAIEVLLRREQDGELSASDWQPLIEIALAQQASTAKGQIAESIVAFAERQYLSGGMNDEQKRQFGQQCVQLALRVDPTVVQGNAVPYKVDESARIGPEPFWVRESQRSVRIDGAIVYQAAAEDEGFCAQAGLGAGGSSGNSVSCTTLGKHKLDVTVRVQLFDNAFFGEPKKGRPLFEQDVKLSGDFVVIERPLTSGSAHTP